MHPGKCLAVQQAEQLIDGQANEANQQNAGKNLVGLQETLRLQDGKTQARVGRHQFCHHQVGPGPAHGDTQGIQQGGFSRRQDHLLQHHHFLR